MSTAATTITGAPAAPAAAAAPPAAAAAAPAVDTAALQAQIDELKEQNAEALRTAAYWEGKSKPAAPAPAATEEEVDVLEAITTGGAKGFDALASKRGFVRREEVEGMINSTASRLAKENELIGEYPDLKNSKSEFFKTTSVHYARLVKEGVPSPVAMETAAKTAELEFLRSGKIKLPGAQPTKEEKEAQKEAERLARVEAQSGENGRRGAARDDDEDDGELDETQKRIADGFGVSHEAYAKRAKQGVAMGGSKGMAGGKR